MLISTHTTGIHCTDDHVEWVVLRKNRAETEKVREGSLPIPHGFFDQDAPPPFPADLLKEQHKEFQGIVTAALPSSQLLMRVLDLPSSDPDELQAMVELQLDRISPFPLDQMALSYELLDQNEEHARVLAVATKRKLIDELGDLFKEQHVYIRSLDAEILAWWSLLDRHGDIPSDGRILLILEEHNEFSMIVVDNGSPICFRSLELFHDFSKTGIADEIIEEIRYTLLSLETEYGADTQCLTEIWSRSRLPQDILDRLETVSPRGVNQRDLNVIPSMAEGLAQRSAERERHHMELVPREWIDLQQRRKTMKICGIASAALLGIWLAAIAITGAVFAVHKASVTRLQKEFDIYAAPAEAAKAALTEKDSLENYANRSHSALECLREITVQLPDSLELTAFNYSKGKSIALRGYGTQARPIADFFTALGSSPLFNGIDNDKQSTDRRTRRETFSVTVELPKTTTGEDQ